ncbi:sialin-like [Convolutriloba macropyga]|uniref:sialin-like n=1 Tax=Convolutriloba macropyga TaxID=536237 RepID=UPI003F526229
MGALDAELESLLPQNDSWYHQSLRGKFTSTRYKIAFLGFVGFGVIYSMRVTMSIAIVDMVTDQGSKDGSFNENCPIPDRLSSPSHSTIRTFNWTSTEQAHILAASFYGYVITQIPGSYLASKYGGKNVFGYSVLIKSAMIIMNPPIAYLGVPWLIVLRILEGAVEGFSIPTFSHLAARWAPEAERTVFYGIAISGCSLGLIIGYPIVGALCTAEFLKGWPLGFLFNGILGLIWFGFWRYTASNSPDSHPRISASERKYINDTTKLDNSVKHKIPWLDIFTSKAFYAYVCAMASLSAVDYSLLVGLPLYFSNLLNFDVDVDGYVCTLPWLSCLIGSIICSCVTDYLRGKNLVTTTFIRRFNQLICSFVTAGFLLAVGYSECRYILSVSFITIGSFFFGSHFAGGYCNNLDIAPYFAGTISAIGITIGSSFGMLMPLAFEIITRKNVHSKELWLYCFYLMAAVSIAGGFLFLILGSGEVQSWGNPQSDYQLEKIEHTEKKQKDNHSDETEELNSSSER